MTRLPVSLNDSQLQFLLSTLEPLPAEKRSVALGRLAARFRQLGCDRPNDDQLQSALRVALMGLQQIA